MSKLTDELIEYLNNASPEQLAQDYEDLKEFNEIGPLVSDFLENSQESFKMNIPLEENNQIYNYNNPEYSGLFCF